MKIKRCFLPSLLVGISILVFLSSLWGIRFTQSDEYRLALGALTEGFWDFGELMVSQMGRIQFFLSLPVMTWVTLHADSVLFDILHYGSLGLTIIAFGFAVSAYAGAQSGLLCALLYSATVALVWEHTSLTASPVWYFSLWGFACLSLIALKLWNTQGKPAWLYTSLIFLFASYWSQEFYCPMFTAAWLVAYTSFKPENVGTITWLRHRPALMGFSLFLFYVLIYMIVRFTNPSEYDGNQLAGEQFSWNGFWSCLVNFSVFTSVIPFWWAGYSFNIYDGISGQVHNLIVWPIQGGWPTLFETKHILVGVLTATAFWLILAWRIQRPPTSLKTIKTLLLVGLLLTFSPNFLVSLTPKYQQWAGSLAAKSYAYSSFSHFGIVLISVALLNYLNILASQRFRVILIGSLSLIVFLVATATDYHNATVGTAMRKNYDRWQSVDVAIKNDYFSQGENHVVLAPRLWTQASNTGTGDGFWSRWAQLKYDTNVNFIKELTPSNLDKEIYWFDFFSLQECGNLAVISAKYETSQNHSTVTDVRLVLENPVLNKIFVAWSANNGIPYLKTLSDLPRLKKQTETRLLPVKRIDPTSLFISCDYKGIGFRYKKPYMGSDGAYKIGEAIYCEQDAIDSFIVSGWSGREPQHRWTEGPKAVLRFKLEEGSGTDLVLRLRARAFLADGKIDHQAIKVLVNGHQTAEWSMRGEGWYEAPIPAALIDEDRVVDIVFEISDPASPAEFGISEDSRKLGIAAQELVLEEAKASSG